MIETAVELVKFVGGLGGLASATFLVYDRVYRDQPSAFLVPKDYKANLRFTNNAAETIIIDEIIVRPPLLIVKRANDLVTSNEERQALFYDSARLNPEKVLIILKPLEERTFALHGSSAEFEHAADDQTITLRCRWQNTRKPLPFKRYIRIKITSGIIRTMREASLANKV
jgi:hypothetical protein